MTLGICSTAIDWDATGSMLQGIGQMITLPLLAWATWVGRQTITKYRQQHQSEKAVAAAERVLTAAYAARDAIASVRSPLVESAEIERAKAALMPPGLEAFNALAERKAEKLARGQVYLDRLNAAKEDFKVIWEAMPMGRAYFGHEVYTAMENIAHQRRVIQVSAEELAHDDGTDKEHSRSIRADLSRATKNDPLGNHVDAQVTLLEERLLPILRSEPPKNYRAPKVGKP